MTDAVRALIVLVVLLAACARSGPAWADSLVVTSGKLSTAALVPPPVYPTSLTTANGSGSSTGRPGRYDTVTVGYSRPLQASSICAGAPQASSTLTGATVTLANGTGGGNDTLSVTNGGASCLSPRLGTIDLGSTGYVTTLSATFSSSTVALSLGAGSTTLVITLGTLVGTVSTVTASTVARYSPDPAMTDTSGNGLGLNTASTTSKQQF